MPEDDVRRGTASISMKPCVDETVAALAETANDMNVQYKETSEAGLALSVTVC